MPHCILNTETEWLPVHSELASFPCFHCLPPLWALEFVAVCTELVVITPYIQTTFTYVDLYHLWRSWGRKLGVPIFQMGK